LLNSVSFQKESGNKNSQMYIRYSSIHLFISRLCRNLGTHDILPIFTCLAKQWHSRNVTDGTKLILVS